MSCKRNQMVSRQKKREEEVRLWLAVTAVSERSAATKKRPALSSNSCSYRLRFKNAPNPTPTCRRAPCPPASGEWTWTSMTRTNSWTRRTEEKTSWVPTRQRWTPLSDNILYMISSVSPRALPSEKTPQMLCIPGWYCIRVSPSAAGVNGGGSASRPLNCPDLPDSHIPGITGPRRRGFVCFYCRLCPPPLHLMESWGATLYHVLLSLRTEVWLVFRNPPCLLDSGISEAGGGHGQAAALCVCARYHWPYKAWVRSTSSWNNGCLPPHPNVD